LCAAVIIGQSVFDRKKEEKKGGKRENSKEKEAKRTGRERKAGKGKEEGKKEHGYCIVTYFTYTCFDTFD